LPCANTDPFEVGLTGWFAAPGAHDSRVHQHDRSRRNIDDLVIETHLAFTLEKNVNLFENRMDVPVTTLLTGNIRIRGEANESSVDFVIDYSSPRSGGVWSKTADKVPP
jgi:hypothetical protein